MEVVIIEDEKLAADKLIMLLNVIDPNILVKCVIRSVEESIKWLTVNTADLIFLDINLSDDLSFKIFQYVDLDTPVIFTTAYNDYAIKAFEQNSVAYLLKPIGEDELRKAIKKYHKFYIGKKEGLYRLIEEIQDLKLESKQFKRRITVNNRGTMRSIAINDIAVFYIQNGTLHLKTFSGTKYFLDETMDHLSTFLNRNFFRVNRRFIVNIEAIEKVVSLSPRKLKVKLRVDVPELILVPTEKNTKFKRWFRES